MLSGTPTCRFQRFENLLNSRDFRQLSSAQSNFRNYREDDFSEKNIDFDFFNHKISKCLKLKK